MQTVKPLIRGRDYRLLSDFVERDPTHPTRCHQCEFYGGPYPCTSSKRHYPSRYPIIHHFMKKDSHGRLLLPYDQNCKFWQEHDTGWREELTTHWTQLSTTALLDLASWFLQSHYSTRRLDGLLRTIQRIHALLLLPRQFLRQAPPPTYGRTPRTAQEGRPAFSFARTLGLPSWPGRPRDRGGDSNQRPSGHRLQPAHPARRPVPNVPLRRYIRTR